MQSLAVANGQKRTKGSDGLRFPTCDGTEQTARAVLEWTSHRYRMALHCTGQARTGRFVESFRDERLIEEEPASLAETCSVIERWRRD